MDESELPLVVPVQIFGDFFNCSICMCQMKDTNVTSCGHRFCGHCIHEWVDRQHKCPCCNLGLNTNQLFKDHQYQSLIAAVESERDKSETQYFDSLINAAASDSQKEGSLSPMELVLKKHLKQSLAAHEKYFQSVKKDFQQKQLELEHKTSKAIGELQGHSLLPEELNQQTEDLNCTLGRQKETVDKELETVTQLVAQAYDKYLSNYIPSLEILPVKVSVMLLHRDVRISEVTVQPRDSISEIISFIEDTMTARNNQIVSWGLDVKYVIFGPFAKCSPCEMMQIVADMVDQGTQHPDIQIVERGIKPILECQLKPGSEIVIYGEVKCESDLPKRCFAQTFKKGEGQAVDYFLCKQCGFQWICRSCMEVCHQGHNIVPYIMNHQPAWACCYCPKKKTCIIQDSTG